MTPLRHNCESLYKIGKGQRVYIGDRPYIVQKHAQGGMGFLLFMELDAANAPAEFSVHGLRVAVKSVLPASLDAESTALFRRELVVWSGLRYGTIVGLNEILDAGHDGWVAAMEWHPGSLRDHILSTGRTSLPDALHVIHDVLNGLAYAYEKDGVLHLDLKPENILYNYDVDRMMRRGEESFYARIFMVADWGIASIKQPQLNAIAGKPPSDEACVKTFNNMGTILYMAPERFVTGYSSSVASDVFSLGMIFLELVTGRLPFPKNCHPVETLLSFSYLRFASELLDFSEVPTPTRKLILSMIAPKSSERPSSYDDLRKASLSVFRRTQGFFSKFF
jgi:eukaryotic-like serine/threonine-protein kinase